MRNSATATRRSAARIAHSSTDRTQRALTDALEPRTLLAAWVNQGPFSSTGGQVEGIVDRPVSGAIHAVLAHPTNPDILYLGGVNGGVWKSTNATAASPSWSATTDAQSSKAIGALAFDSADGTAQTLWAGNGRYSSYGRIGGARAGLLRTTNGAASWTRVTGGGVLVGKGISGIAANGSNIVVSVNTADSFTFANIGIFRSVDGGSTFTAVTNGAASNGIPEGVAYDLVVDPLNASVMYTSIALTSTASNSGIYKSTNGGATWSRVSNATMNGLFTNNTSNAELAVGRSGEVYAAVLNSGVPAGLFRSPNGGSTWNAMDIPTTNENGTNVGLNPGGTKGPTTGTPEEIAGGQGSIHFSIVADPTNANIVYVGGDRQPRSFGDTGTFPNSIGALDFTGRLFRGDASQPSGSQWVHLTHRNNLGAAGGGTASNSAPHADSRDMTFDANGNLIESDDGGIYRRTNPRSNTGDWFSLNGTLAVTEVHDVAYDSLSNTIIAGTQDNGTTQQGTEGASTWNNVSNADGGDVVVDEITLAGSNQTIRYTSFQNLGGLARRVYNAAGTQVSVTTPARTVVSGATFSPAFRTPLQLNAINPARMIIQGSNSTYESLDQAATLREIGPGRGTTSIEQDAIAYGGRLNGVPNPDVLYVGSGANLLLRTSGTGNIALVPSQPVTTTIRDITIDPDAHTSVALLTASQIHWSTNAGTSWTNITGNLTSLATEFRSLAYIPGAVDAIIAGTGAGVFVTSVAQLGVWIPLGTGMPKVPVFEMEYDATDNILVAGTFGRGAWTLSNVTSEIVPAVIDRSFNYVTAPQNVTVQFSLDVAASLSESDFVLDNLTTATAIPTSQLQLVPAGANTFSIRWPGVTGGVAPGALPDGNYRFTVKAAGVTTALGVPLPADFEFHFRFLNGDADQNGTVNFDDLLVLASNYNASGRNFPQGDFNYDGTVNFDDLLILAARYNTTLPGSPLAAATVPPIVRSDDDEDPTSGGLADVLI